MRLCPRKDSEKATSKISDLNKHAARSAATSIRRPLRSGDLPTGKPEASLIASCTEERALTAIADFLSCRVRNGIAISIRKLDNDAEQVRLSDEPLAEPRLGLYRSFIKRRASNEGERHGR